VIKEISTHTTGEKTPTKTEKSQQSADRRSASWDLQNAVPNYISLLFSQGGSAIFSFASVWILTHYIGKEGYGGVVAIIAASQIAQILVNWTGFSVIRFGVDEFLETGKITRIFWLRLLVLVPNLSVVFLLSSFWFSPLAQWLKLSNDVFWLLILHFAASALWLHLQFGLQGAKMPKKQGFLLTVERSLIFIGLIVLLAVGKLTVSSAFFCYAAVPLLMSLIGFWELRNVIFGNIGLDFHLFKSILRYSFPLLPFSFIGYFSSGYIDAVFVSSFLSTGDLGIYWVASTISGQLLQLPTLANSLLIPLFITLNKESQTQRTQQFFVHILPSLILFWGLFCNIIVFIGYYIFPLVFKKEFAEAIPPFWVLLSVSVLAIPILIGYSALSHATSKTYISMFAALASATANVVFDFLLIPKYGMIGCAWATAAAYLVGFVVFGGLLWREKLMRLSWIFQAMLPSLISAISFTITRNPVWALFVSCVLFMLVSYQYYNSLKSSVILLRNFRKV
jgi:O-antigen/teichoic acid export membrane protein